jgi:hypothetical protein
VEASAAELVDKDADQQTAVLLEQAARIVSSNDDQQQKQQAVSRPVMRGSVRSSEHKHPSTTTEVDEVDTSMDAFLSRTAALSPGNFYSKENAYRTGGGSILNNAMTERGFFSLSTEMKAKTMRERAKLLNSALPLTAAVSQGLDVKKGGWCVLNAQCACDAPEAHGPF